MIRSGVSVSDRMVWRIFSAKSAAPRRPSPSLAGRTTSRRWVSKAATAARAVTAAASRRGRRAATAGSADARLGGRHRIRDQHLHAGQLTQRGLGLEPPDRPVRAADQRRPGGLEHGRQPLQPAGRRGQAVGQRRELAGEQREQPFPREVDPVERVPGVLAQDRLREPGGLQLADEQVPIDGVLGRQVGHGGERRQPALGHRLPLGPPGRRQVRPARVMRVLADARREDGCEPERLGQERLDGVSEGGHDRDSTPMSARSSAKSQPRVSPGSIRTTRPAPVVVVVVGCGLADVAARDPPDLGTVWHVQHPGDAAKLEPAVWERFVGDHDGHPRLARDVLELAVAGGHPEGEPAVLPDVPDGGKHDRAVGPDRGKGREVTLVEEPAQLLGG